MAAPPQLLSVERLSLRLNRYLTYIHFILCKAFTCDFSSVVQKTPLTSYEAAKLHPILVKKYCSTMTQS